MFKTSIKTGVVAGLVAVLAVGCGDDDSSNSPRTDMGMPDSGAPDSMMPAEDGMAASSIVDIAAASSDFSTLVAAVTRAGLVDTLKGAGPFTVFAPTDKAFADSGITDLNSIPLDQLKTILLYHVLPGQVGSSQVSAGPADTAASLTLFLGTTGGVAINGGNAVKGGANVVQADIMASNGVIHVIDRVILPPDIPTCAIYGGLDELVNAVGAAADLPGGTSVISALQGAGPYTVFAPTNAAFQAISAPSDPAALRDVLLYHVVSGSVESSAIPAKADSLLTNQWGNGVTLLFDTSSGAKVNGAGVAIADIRCTNGIVHVIDQVLLPPTIVDMVGIAGLSELGKAVGAAAALPGGTSVADALRASEPYTVFAPTDAAFQGITAPSDPAVLRDVLLLHVVKAGSPVLSSQLPASAVDTLLSGEKLSFNAATPAVSSDGTPGAKIGPFDINVTNGVVHVIDQVLLP
jgi:transforming growth factor-beta-induced protein